jgi:hypothetical protein
MKSETEVDRKEDMPNRIAKGKSSPVTIAEKLVILREIADNRNAITIPRLQDHRATGRDIPLKTTTMPLEA